jgi:hypothetical protein
MIAVRRFAGILALCFVSAPAWADEVLYKCIDGKGAVSIQSSACPKGSTQAWKRDTAAMAAAVSSAPMPPQATAPAIHAGQAPRPADDAGHSGPPVPPPPPAAPESVPDATAPVPAAEDPCDHAKDVAAQLHDMPWLGLSSDQQQRLMGWVMLQCRQAPSERP